jgi:hypothetical protein
MDIALIHIWHNGGASYELDLEVQWTNADYARTNEELCIYAGTTGAENIRVDVWNGSAWINILTDLTANSWNNVSVSSYLGSAVFTIRFKGGTEISDTNQDSWNIDATLLHVWTYGATFDYVLRVNNTITDSFQIRLKKYADSNIGRLQNCGIYFRNSTNANSTQIIIENGSFNQAEGTWFTLSPLETIYVALTSETERAGTSYIYVHLEARKPGTTTCAQYTIAFEVT